MNKRAYARESAECHVVLTTLPNYKVTVYHSEGGVREVVECANREEAFNTYDEWVEQIEQEILDDWE